jgi:diadenylate cyclase
MPDPAIPTEESGTRHRTAQRVALQTGFPVISVSQSMRIISLYMIDRRYVLQSTGELLSRANQAIATLERYKARLDEVSNALSALEIEDLATVRDAAIVSQRLEMVRRIADEVTGQVVELGTDGRLLDLQLEELMAGVDADRELIARDYVPSGRRARTSAQVLGELSELSATDLLDLTQVARAMGLPSTPEGLDNAVSPRGHRLLSRVPRMPGTILDRVVDHFGGLQKLLAASAEDLQVVDGIGETRARAVREAISRLAEVSIIDRYS